MWGVVKQRRASSASSRTPSRTLTARSQREEGNVEGSRFSLTRGVYQERSRRRARWRGDRWPGRRRHRGGGGRRAAPRSAGGGGDGAIGPSRSRTPPPALSRAGGGRRGGRAWRRGA